MSVYRATPSLYGRTINWLRNTFIRRGTSRATTGLYARIGFADRNLLAQQLSQLNVENINHDLLVDRLVEQGVLKGRFRHEILELGDIEHFMLKATPPGRLEIEGVENFSGLDVDPLFASNYGLVSSLSRSINHHFYSIIQFRENEPLANAFSIGAKAAKGIGIALGIAGGAWFLGGLPALSPGLALAGLTATCVLATRYNDKFPLHGKNSWIGSVARFASRRVAPWLYAADGIYLGNLVYEANLRITSIFDSIGLEGTTAVLFGLGLAGYTFLKSNLQAFNKSYGGQLDPGMQKYMRRLVTGMALSTMAEVHYIGTRLLLFGGASAYLLMNTIQNLGVWGTIPLAIPILGFGLTVALRSRKDVTYESKEQADRLDHLKVWAPLWGMAAGLAAAGIQGLADWSVFSPIAYTTLYGSFATLFLNEMHGAFHSINTNLGGMHSLRASSKDLVGEREKRELSDGKSMLIVNPHTGLVEHSYGLLFSALLNRKPGASFICMYDLICAQTGNRNNHRLERKFVAQVQRMQQVIYQQLTQGIGRLTATDPAQRQQQLLANYRWLIANLRGLSDYFDNGLQQAILRMAGQHAEMVLSKTDKEVWFFPMMELAEARRAIFEQMSLRGQEFSKLADQLEAQVARAAEGYVSEDNFYQHWNQLLRCYDPEFVTTMLVARKSVAGDEKMIRKVENVASGLILRGLTAYKGFFIEKFADPTGAAARDPFQNEDWISGTWTSVPNPAYRYDAEPGSLASAKYIWLHRDHVLTELQAQNEAFLSTSARFASVDNTPSEAEGFVPGPNRLTVIVNGTEQPLNAGEYFFSQDPNQVPRVKRPIPRPNLQQADLIGYRLAWDSQHLLSFRPGNGRPEVVEATSKDFIDQQPLTLRPPAFDYTLMMDKNDVQVNPDLLPTILERARHDVYLHLMLRYPLKKQYDFVNPHPDREIDLSQGGISVIDTTFELSYTHPEGRELVIPVKIDRFAVSMGVMDKITKYRESLSNARVVMSNGQPTYVGLIYRGMPRNSLSAFQHGLITREDLTSLGDRTGSVWQALIDKGYIQEQPGVGLVESRVSDLPVRIQIRLSREHTALIRSMLLSADPITRESLEQQGFVNNSEAIWQTLIENDYIKEEGALVTVLPAARKIPEQLDIGLTEEQTTILRTILTSREVINKDNLSHFGLKADLIWRTLRRHGFISETSPVGLVQAKFYERPESFALGPVVEKILARAPRLKHIWKALHQAGYLDETEFSGSVKDDFAIVQWDFGTGAFNLPGKYSPDLLAQIQQIVTDNVREMSLPPRYYPEFLSSLELPENGEAILTVNNFMRRPHREGEAAWIKIPYTDGTVAFARTVDGDRPMLANKDYREYLRRQRHAGRDQ